MQESASDFMDDFESAVAQLHASSPFNSFSVSLTSILVDGLSIDRCHLYFELYSVFTLQSTYQFLVK